MRKRACRLLPLVAFVAAAAWAQESLPPTDSIQGSVSGHVYCADTNAPARLARVTLEPEEDFEDVDQNAKVARTAAHRPATIIANTKLDGSYSFEKVAPGTYYAMAEMPGYLSPLANFPFDDLDQPEAEVKQQLRRVLQQVTVVGNQVARLDFLLERGGALSGTVHYQDGSPVIGAPIDLMRKDKDGTWRKVSDPLQHRSTQQGATDDLGGYRITSLPPSQYLVSVDLRLISMSVSGSFLAEPPAWSGAIGEPVHIYFGDAVRMRDAKTVSVGTGEDRSGVDITVPISKLHSVSGTVVSEQDEHPLDSGTVLLLDAFDRSTMMEAWLNPATGTFELNFVPEGEYVLKVSSAADSVVETGKIPGLQAGTYTRRKAVRDYVDTEQPLSVRGEISGVVVEMIAKKVTSKKADSGDVGSLP